MPHLFQLGPRRHLLGHQCRLDPVEEPLQPAHQLGLGDPQLGLGGRLLVEGDRDPLQLLAKVGREPFGQLSNRLLVDLAEPAATGVVERGPPDLLSSCLTIEPILMTLAGCSIASWASWASPSSGPASGVSPAVTAGITSSGATGGANGAEGSNGPAGIP